jgi:peroxiredoxin Q/BCP
MTPATVALTLALNLLTGSAPPDETGATTPSPPTTIQVGSKLSVLKSVCDTGQPWNSSDLLGQVLVLYFYPGDFTGGCTRQAQAYRDALAKIESLGAEVVGVSGDEVATHQLFKKTHDLRHTLLADTEGKLAGLLGVPVKAGGRVRATGPDRKPLLDEEGKRINIERPVTLGRWTIVVGRDGRIASIRSVTNPVTDAEEVVQIVESLAK